MHNYGSLKNRFDDRFSLKPAPGSDFRHPREGCKTGLFFVDDLVDECVDLVDRLFLVELPVLGGRKLLEGIAPVHSLMSLEGVE